MVIRTFLAFLSNFNCFKQLLLKPMKNILATLLLSFFLMGISCEKTGVTYTTEPFRVKIISEICGTAVVQIQDEVFYKYGTDGFIKEGVTYNHVFTTQFSCADLAKLQSLTANKTGLVIKIQLINSAIVEPNCVRCEATVSNAPSLFQHLSLTQDWSN